MRIAVLTLLAIVTLTSTDSTRAAESSVIVELRNSLFEAANSALGRANAVQANLLAPTTYARGAEYYRRAETTLTDGGSIDSIRRDLERATQAFDDAAVQGELGRTTFESTLRAREDAISAGAESHATELWEEARSAFADAAVRLEKGRIERAQQQGTEAERLFRDAELKAIKANYLSETRTLLEAAREARADRYAPRSYGEATRLIEEAEAALNNNRYDTDLPRNLAAAAKHSALHANHIAKLEADIRAGTLNLEDLLMDWEASIQRLADLVDAPVHFDAGQVEAVSRIEAEVTGLQSEIKRLEAALAERQIQLDTLVQETASMERLAKLVARQERQKERLARVEALFSREEATVLRQQDSIILRMIGLSFDVGKWDLKPEHELLLNSLRQAIGAFPESNIVIEGHTDSFGSEVDNLALSQHRADALQQYLLANSPISPANLTALGYGETRPVANNETRAGRAQNRRIDVVIYPKW